MALLLLYPQISNAAEFAARDPGCNVPKGFDCATPGYERPVTLEEAIDISKLETVVYLYGKGIQSVDTAAHVITQGKGAPAVPAVAMPGRNMPEDTFYVIVLGNVVKHRVSGEPAEFRQRYIDRGTVFGLTRNMYSRLASEN